MNGKLKKVEKIKKKNINNLGRNMSNTYSVAPPPTLPTQNASIKKSDASSNAGTFPLVDSVTSPFGWNRRAPMPKGTENPSTAHSLASRSNRYVNENECIFLVLFETAGVASILIALRVERNFDSNSIQSMTVGYVRMSWILNKMVFRSFSRPKQPILWYSSGVAE